MASSLVLAYALPENVLQPFLTPGLELDTYRGFGFLAIAMVQTRELRPAFLPPGFGLNFFLTGYRIFTRYRTLGGRSLRGLRILRSDTDRRSMRTLGNLLTHYGYELSRCRVLQTENSYQVEICTPKGDADLKVVADLATEPQSPPPGSPFADMREARKFAGPLPFTFDYERQTHSVIRVEGVRQAWNPRPVSVEVQRNTFLEREPFRSAKPTLANAFYLENVPYSWKPGIRETLP
ncbi:MAG TPA: DUF2071 domain-containing protein [Acidobacteriaceae bacterium]|nr:DUF2071 domain-containing protein [Acidobacteriaceae bacterium]